MITTIKIDGKTYQLIADGISQTLRLRVAVERELLGFYRLDTVEKLLTPTELAEQLQQERQQADKLTEYLRSQGVDPDSLS
ncbi:hypothetical protein [Nostoc sp. FACHB-888]|uniref:hypothetical protein n=1 Tax=Nostoc sp. FACHB-888 TaxID=2692842 RepID=UPI001683E837|nr:hypothetical protein [Nostoc sp. FACHB-888]MBD2246365.1 hypothetical protein [Nostoc sp. FACHB-888]